MPRSRSVPADADTVFEIASDLANMSWLPGVDTELSAPRLLRVWFRERDVELPITIDWERLYVEWGTDAADYASRLHVVSSSSGTCVVSVHLNGPPGVLRTMIGSWTDDALTALVTEVVRTRGAQGTTKDGGRADRITRTARNPSREVRSERCRTERHGVPGSLVGVVADDTRSAP